MKGCYIEQAKNKTIDLNYLAQSPPHTHFQINLQHSFLTLLAVFLHFVNPVGAGSQDIQGNQQKGLFC